MKTKLRYKIYLVTWEDAYQMAEDSYRKGDDYTPLRCTEIGFLMEENDKTLVMATSFSMRDDELAPEGMALNIIPWEYIINIEELVL